MISVSVCASQSYEVKIGRNLLPTLGQEIANVCHAGKIAIISDSNVFPLYGNTVESTLRASGFEICSFVFPAGENSKTPSVYLEILDFLSENQLTRSDCMVALGGGVVGDITGFAAATYLRGIAYVQVPTTLLAMVDSSVGGKTAIDLPAGKNLVGAFYQPKLVLCDTDTLHTLPEEDFRDGCAEIIKYAMVFDKELFTHLQRTGLAFDREAVISKCVTLKRDVVAADEFDRGQRMLLNFGHTLGHAVEARSNYRLSHGKSVAIGMAIVCRSCANRGLCPRQVCDALLNLLTQFSLPTTTDNSAQQLCAIALSDKKRSGDTVHLIVPKSVGNCEISPICANDLIFFTEAGL